MKSKLSARTVRRNRTVSMIASALIAALSVVILLIGCIVDMLDLSMAALCCLLVWLVLLEYGPLFAFLCYAVTALLAFLLLPSKLPCFLFGFVTGWYPLAKFYIDKLRPRLLRFLLKLLSVNAAAVLMYALFKTLLGMEHDPLWLLLAELALCDLAFLFLDIVMRKLIPFYILKIRPRLPKGALLQKN